MADDLKSRITDDMKSTMRAKDTKKLGVIRMLMAAIKQREVDERITLDDSQVLEVLNTMMKQRRGSIEEFEKAGRQDLADNEKYEIEILQAYLPPQLSEDEVNAMIKQAIDETGAESMKDMGKVMAILKPKMQGRTDLGKVSGQVKSLLNA